jgi:putative phage-type endonuclease
MSELSPERVGRITGSRVAGILGVSPYNDRDSVMREMVRQRLGAPAEFSGNIATEWGLEHEPEAVGEYEKFRGVMVHSDQQIVIHPTLDYLAVTPDGLIGDTGLLEVKCPYKAGYTSIEDRPDYAEQVQLQLFVTGRDWADFVVWRPTGIAVSRVERDPSWWANRGGALDAFIAEYESIIYDDTKHAVFLDEMEPERDDFDWQLAAVEYLEAHAALKRAETEREQARARLVQLAADVPARGAGVSVTRAERKGSLDYSKAAKDLLTGYDLEPYRKPSTTVVTVRVAS